MAHARPDAKPERTETAETPEGDAERNSFVLVGGSPAPSVVYMLYGAGATAGASLASGGTSARTASHTYSHAESLSM